MPLNNHIEQLPTFTKWLPFEDSRSKAKRSRTSTLRLPQLSDDQNATSAHVDDAAVAAAGASGPARRGYLPCFDACGGGTTEAATAPDFTKDNAAGGGDGSSGHRHSKCLPAFHVCGGKSAEAATTKENAAVDLRGEESSDPRNSKSAGRRCMPGCYVCGGRTTEAATAPAPDLTKEDAAVDLRKEGSGGQRHSKSAGWRCMPAFQICGGRTTEAATAPDITKEIAAVDLGDEGRSGHRDSKSAGSRCLPAFNICGRGGAAVAPDPSEEEKGVAAVAPDPDLRGEGSGCCCCAQWGCLPNFHICGRRKVVPDAGDLQEKTGVPEGGNGSRPARRRGCLSAFRICAERKGVAGEKDHEGVTVAAAGDADLTGEHSKSAPGRCSWPKLHMCGGRRSAAGAGISDISKEEKLSAGSVGKEEGAVAGVQEHGKEEEGVSDSGQEAEGGCCRFFKCGRKGGKGSSCCGRSSKSERSCWMFQSCRSWWFPTFSICGGKKKVSVAVPDPREEILVAGGVSARHEEVVAAASATDGHDEAVATGRCGCRGGCLSPFRTCRRRKTVAEGKEGSRHRSKPKSKGSLRRRGRRQQREGKDRKKFKIFNRFQ